MDYPIILECFEPIPMPELFKFLHQNQINVKQELEDEKQKTGEAGG